MPGRKPKWYIEAVNRLRALVPFSVLALLLWPASLFGEYTLIFNNGRRITVESYREEGGMIKFQGLGGEIGIAKDQIESILKSGPTDTRGLVVPKAGDAPSAVQKDEPSSSPSRQETTEAKKSAGEPRNLPPEDERARAEGEYQLKLNRITAELESLKNRYLTAGKGVDPSENTLTSQKAMEAWATELSSKIKDSAKLPVSEYSPKERELSELRKQIDELQKEREKVVQEMKERGFETSSAR